MNFYILHDRYGNFAEAIRDVNVMNTNVCDDCQGVHSKKTSNLRIYFKGKKEADFYIAPPFHIVTQRFQDVLSQHHFSGFSFEDVELTGWYDSMNKPIEKDVSGIKEWVISGRAGKLRHLDGAFVTFCPTCQRALPEGKKEVNGLSVHLEEWDGSDIFYFKNWFGMVIVTEKVKKVLEKNKIKNIQFQHIKDFKFTGY